MQCKVKVSLDISYVIRILIMIHRCNLYLIVKCLFTSNFTSTINGNELWTCKVCEGKLIQERFLCSSGCDDGKEKVVR